MTYLTLAGCALPFAIEHVLDAETLILRRRKCVWLLPAEPGSSRIAPYGNAVLSINGERSGNPHLCLVRRMLDYPNGQWFNGNKPPVDVDLCRTVASETKWN